MSVELTENAAKRLVPVQINGHQATPFMGVGKYRPEGCKAAAPVRTCADYPDDGNKVAADLKTALKNAGLRDGMTVSTHHHFRNGDKVGNAARAAGVQPFDTVSADVADMDGLRESVLEAKGLGFDGKGCIHPRQIAVIHEAFAPTKDELEKAQRIVEAFEEAEKKGLGVVSLGSKMIDPPVVKRAQRVVELAKEMANSQ